MNVWDAFMFGKQMRAEGKLQAAMEVWSKISQQFPPGPTGFGPVFAEIADVHRTQNNPAAERDQLLNFMNSPILGCTFHLYENIKKRIEDIDKQLNPPPNPPPPPPTVQK